MFYKKIALIYIYKVVKLVVNKVILDKKEIIII